MTDSGDMTPEIPWSFAPGWHGLGQRLTVAVGKVALRSVFSVIAENAPDLRKTGPVILAPNHCSFLDPPILQLCIPRNLSFLMTEPLFRTWGLRWFFHFWGVLPVPLHGQAGGAMKGALQALSEGRSVVIFPEGRISDDGRLQDAQGGVALLIARAGVPVVPVAILGTHQAMPRGALLPRPGRIRVRFGDPIAPPPKIERQRRRLFAAEVMDAIHALGAPR